MCIMNFKFENQRVSWYQENYPYYGKYTFEESVQASDRLIFFCHAACNNFNKFVAVVFTVFEIDYMV